MKKFVSMLLALALCCMLVPGVAENASPTGTWYISGAQSEDADIRVIDPKAIVLTVNGDGTFSLNVREYGAEQKGTWSVAESVLTLAVDQGDPSYFRIDGDELVYEMGATSVRLSRTPGEPEPLAAQVPAESAAAFNGTWVPHAQMVMGLYSPLSAETAAASGKLSIQDGKVETILPGDDGKPYVLSSNMAAFTDGSLTFEETSFGTKSTLSLLDDGTLEYRAAISMGEVTVDMVYFYIPEGEEIVARMPDPGWVLDSVNGAVWQDDRASLEVFLEDTDNYKVLILWGSSAWESEEWVYACDYDAATQTLNARYQICDHLVYDDAGEETRTNVYEKDSTAVFALNGEGKLVLTNAGDDALEGKTFECIGVPAGDDAE